MKANIRLIEMVVNSELERHYAAFILLKQIHVNSRVYNYSDFKLSKQSGISRTSIKKYITFFINEGWAIKQGKDLYLISHNKLKSKYGIKLKSDLKLKKHRKIQDLVKSLRYEIFKLKQSQFKRLKELQEYRTNPKGINALKRYKNSVKKLQRYTCEFSENLKISINKLGVLINKSASTASRLIKDKKAIVIKGRKVICKFNQKAELPTGLFAYKGYIFKSECNQYIF